MTVSGAAHPDTDALAGLLGAIDASAAGFTLCEVARGIGLIGSSFDGISAYQVLSGTMNLRLGDGRTHVARQGSLVLVPPGLRPTIASEPARDLREVDGERCFGRRDGWLVADATENGHRDLVVAAARISGTAGVALARPVVLPVGGTEEGVRIVTMLSEEFNRRDGSRALAWALMSGCIILGLRAAIQGDQMLADSDDHRHKLIARALGVIAARPSDPHTVDSLAQTAGMSRATFVRQFSRIAGSSPMSYLQQRRIKEAAAMLRSTDLPVKVVASRSGFANASHFSRAFRQASGLDPSAYRLAIDVD